MSDEEDVEAPVAPPKSKMMPLVLIVNTLLLAGVLVFVMRKPAAGTPPATPAAAAGHGAPAEAAAGHGAAGPAAGEEPGAEGAGAPGPMLKLENFIIQLKTLESEPRYVRVAFDLELGSEPDKTVITARMAPIRDSVISYFADRSLDELRGSEAMEQTKAILLKRLDAIIPGRRLKAIYITDFVIQ